VEPDAGISTLRDYLTVLWRRKWIVLQAVVLVPLAAALLSARQAPVYSASAGVLINPENLPANLAGVYDPTQLNAARTVQTEAELARVPEVARRTVEAAGLNGWSASDVLGVSSVTTGADSDILTFSVRHTDPDVTAKVATEYARQFTLYRLELETRALKAAREAAQARIEALEESGDTDSALYESLVEQQQRLETMESLQTSRAVLVRPATGAAQIEPRPLKNAIIGLALGLVLGVGLAFLWEALDSRVRSAEGVGKHIRLPLLGRIPQPPRALRKEQRLVMLDDPNGPQAEAFRILRARFELANIDIGARSVMVTSGVEKEGKSTTVANLAVALARAGRRVTLVDLDLRSASLHRFFEIPAQPGITDVVLGRVPLARALAPVDLGDLVAGEDNPMVGQGNGYAGTFKERRLEVLPAGSLPSSAGEFIARLPLRRILSDLRKRSDIVLIDGPPLLRVGDAIAASSGVDALLVVARLNVIRGPMLEDLGRILRTSPARKLGVIILGADLERGYEYLAYPYEGRRSPSEVSVSPPR
jgi:Mrp family chromosome partitioning ATPase/capsular polysaccharide biosynthesis protein